MNNDNVIMQKKMEPNTMVPMPSHFDETNQSALQWSSMLKFVHNRDIGETLSKITSKYPFFIENFEKDIIQRAAFLVWWQREADFFVRHMATIILEEKKQ